MPEQICLEERCSNPATYRGRCSTHAKRRDKSIQRAADPGFYQSPRWRYARRAKIMRETWCQRCQDALATEVHHIISIADGGAKYEMDNLEALCKPCHSRETRREQTRAG